MSLPVPTLDFTRFAAGESDPSFVRGAGDSLRDSGFFILKGHGVQPEVIRAAYGAAAEFFALPDAVKRRYEVPELKGQRGYTRFGRERAKGHQVPDLKEFWHVGRAWSQGDPPTGFNQNLWPREVPRFREALEDLYRQLDACALRLLQAVSLYLDEPLDLLPGMAQMGNSLLRVIHYPAVDEIPSDGLRAAPHEDINLITLLPEATDAGLELLTRDGKWLPVVAAPGEIIVDAGDMLQNLSNGLLRSTTHRVTNTGDARKPRFSMPFFVHPRPEVSLAPRDHCIARSGGVPRFPAITAAEYLAERLREIGLA